MVQLEAMLCGRPVVSTDLPTGVPWVNVHGETGLVVPPAMSTALTTALQRIVADDGRCARQWARQRRQRARKSTSPPTHGCVRQPCKPVCREVSQACS